MIMNKKDLDLFVCRIAFAVLALAVLLGGAYKIGLNQSSRYDEPGTAFDTSIIEKNWCGNFSNGEIRMVGAEQYTRGILIDETGQLWAVDTEEDLSNYFILLWVADNHTPDNILDDIVLKIWVERG